MPGAGKSTIGIILAKNLGLGFIDTDVLIQINQQKSLQQIINESDHLHLRAIEEEEILKIDIEGHVIATGGGVAYSEKAMTYLKSIRGISEMHLCEQITKIYPRGFIKPKNI